ncbi:sigma-70 family RNA polymerase sigma factor [Methylobacterium terricola]|uniref:RNA polymerase sigma factor n=1 Tax=Methylobacterium terricola TaxID=2583531 RepID=A0A5C4L6C2_9HYPH|nr:sigma-70 family RNA polymerase sigma factor [Methylobacterium terricola]TNC05954.1 sigma-70 family RNA polymerase sigma factor [Methylobacterium terricola]
MTWRFPKRDDSQGQERPSFEQIVLPNLNAAYSLARWLVRDPQLAEDVVQDAVVRGLTYFSSFRGGDPRAWLMRIVRNTAYSALTAQQQSLRRLETRDGLAGEDALSVPDPGAGPEAALCGAQDAERLTEALAALPPELRECLVLRELEELSYKEIALVTNVPIGTVMSRLWRARKMLLGAAAGGEDEH